MESVAAAETRTKDYVANFISLRRLSKSSFNSTDINVSILPYFTNKHVGKVRDTYVCDDLVILVCTDRQSAFDRNIASIPFKGQVLNLTSAWWFEQTKTLVPNHVISIPHPNVTIGKKCSVFPIEFVMRGYITGSTSTSIWTNYSKGIRSYCGHKLPDGLSKNMKLETNLLTPTTKDDYHDELISAEDVVLTGKMTQSDWDTCAKYSQLLFSFGQATALQNGLILVDTKYEFGKDPNGNVILVDEIHTPDSSRYWICSTYNERISNNLEPENVDKEFLRKWYIEHCDPYNDIDLPCAPDYLVDELSRRYIMLFELITGKNFDFKESPSLSIEESLKKFFEK